MIDCRLAMAIDPGIDAAGVAIFQHEGDFPGFEQALRRLFRYEVIRTKASAPLPERLGILGSSVDQLVRELPVDLVLIEEPAIAGVYSERRNRQRGRSPINAAAIGKLHMATGALAYGAWGLHRPRVLLVSAPKLEKKIRQAMVRNGLQRQGHPLGFQPKPSPDLLDAVWLGAAALGDRRWGAR